MNTEIRFNAPSPTGSSIMKVVFPQDANFGEGTVSILAPLGAALLGRRRGETVSYSAPGGEIQIEIVEIIYQPESSGDFVS